MKRKKIKKIILISIAALTACGGFIMGVLIYRILNKPEAMFEINTPKPTASVEKSSSHLLPKDITPSKDDNTSDEEQTQTENTINILLAGIDAYEDGSTTSGTMPHTDAMLVVAVNFDKNTVDLISLPRDTFTVAPGYNGIYKLNGVFNVGGGWEDPEGGFQLVMRAAEEWLGGISIPYYYGVDFKAVIDIVDELGGIDYDVDQAFTISFGKDMGKKIYEGQHHLDGAACLSYMRIRKEADSRDSSRTERQRKMLVAIFNKLKNEGTISMIPSLIHEVNSGIWTNTNLMQTVALANYAMKTDDLQINIRSMGGKILLRHDWAYCFVDQQNRIDLIKEVFDMDVGPVKYSSYVFEDFLCDAGFTAKKFMVQAEKTFAKTEGMTLSGEQSTLLKEAKAAYETLSNAYDEAARWYMERYDGIPKGDESAGKALSKALKEATDPVKKTCSALANSINFKDINWNIPRSYWNDKDINEVLVDFA